MKEHRPAQRFHVTRCGKRTTVTLDSILSEYLALHLGQDPHTPSASASIRAWLQDRTATYDGTGGPGLSNWLGAEVLVEIVKPEILTLHAGWRLAEMLR